MESRSLFQESWRTRFICRWKFCWWCTVRCPYQSISLPVSNIGSFCAHSLPLCQLGSSWWVLTPSMICLKRDRKPSTLPMEKRKDVTWAEVPWKGSESCLRNCGSWKRAEKQVQFFQLPLSMEGHPCRSWAGRSGGRAVHRVLPSQNCPFQRHSLPARWREWPEERSVRGTGEDSRGREGIK